MNRASVPQVKEQAEVESAINTAWSLEIFYDGDCPLCRREIKFMRKKDSSNRLIYTDIADPQFDAVKETGKTFEELMAKLHGRLPSGNLIAGPEVFRIAYAELGYRSLVKLSRLPLISQLIGLGYNCFARLRPYLPGRKCDDTCRVLPNRESRNESLRSKNVEEE